MTDETMPSERVRLEAGRMAARGADNVFHELNRDPNWQPSRADYTTLGYLLQNIAGTAGARSTALSKQPVPAVGWRDIASAPRDGTWFVAACFGYGDPDYEVGRYQPLMHDRFVEAGDGLYRKQPEQIYDWQGFNNFHRMTHWSALSAAPAPSADREGQ